MSNKVARHMMPNDYDILNTWNKILLLSLFWSSIHSQPVTQLYDNQYITKCASFEFRNLENLIGSIHIHEPNAVLRIRDQGLTNGQRMILSYYQNTEIVPATYLGNGERIIYVTDELTYNKTRQIATIRQCSSNINNADSIRKKIRLAVVVPFIRGQSTALLEQLHASTIYTPCRNHSLSTSLHDLILYHNEAPNAPWIDDLRPAIDRYDFLKDCFRHIRILAANLAPEQNTYPVGSAYMWKRLLDEEGPVSLRTLGYTHFFLMEPDTRPIKSYWMDAIMQKIVETQQLDFIPTDWWMFGSIYRGSQDIGLHFLHINGNAIYHLSSNFLDFLRLVWESYPYESDRSLGYDLDIFRYMLDPQNYDLTKRVWHKFRYSDFIQNCWHTGCPDVESNAHTFLIHGKHDFRTNDYQRVSLFFLKYLACFILMILIVFFLFRRRSLQRHLRKVMLLECLSI